MSLSMTAVEFEQFLGALRKAEPQAAEELLRAYEPVLRRLIRMRLKDSHLRRSFDSGDICQSVLADFFALAREGRFDLASPDALSRLLATMARNRIISKARLQATRPGPLPSGWEPFDGAKSPSQDVANRDLVETIYAWLSGDERWLVDQRTAGRSWEELATETGTSPDALRMRHARAIARVRRELQKEPRDAQQGDS
jgi:RNA polymerase sigma factor (sigma-70 family)